VEEPGDKDGEILAATSKRVIIRNYAKLSKRGRIVAFTSGNNEK